MAKTVIFLRYASDGGIPCFIIAAFLSNPLLLHGIYRRRLNFLRRAHAFCCQSFP